MSEDTAVYSTQQLGTALGLGTAMVRKWAIAYERLTGRDIAIKRRDGRQFSREDFRIISAAKSLVDSNKGLTVDMALKMTLAGAQIAPEGLQPVSTSNNPMIPVQAILEGLSDLKTIREELQALREQVAAAQATHTPPKVKNNPAGDSPGLIVRLAIRLEDLLKRLR